MRLRWFSPLVTLCIASCASTPSAPPSPLTSQPLTGKASHVTPANIRRLRPAFPAGYEVTETLATLASPNPAGYWGMGANWAADPPQCAALANPVSGGAPPQGLAASGPGGIVYAVVAASDPPPVLDPVVVAGCSHWTMADGPSGASVDLVPAPGIDDTPTTAMSAAAHTVVEGGTETDSHFQTVTAYLDEFLVFVVVVTDPGAPHQPLPPDFAATLLVKAVATLRD